MWVNARHDLGPEQASKQDATCNMPPFLSIHRLIPRPSPSRLHLPFSQVASVGPDIKDCSKNFPRAILYAAGMQTLINGTIHLVAAGATDPALYPEWEPGYLRCASERHFTQALIVRPIFFLLQIGAVSLQGKGATGNLERRDQCRI